MTFQIRDIVTFRGEALFWSAILGSHTPGTSMGDFLSASSGLGYAGGALLVTARSLSSSGLNLGAAGSSAVLPAVLVGLMAYAQVQERRTADPRTAEREAVAQRAD